MSLLDGVRPSGTLEWVSPVIPVVTQAAVGAGHWASGRRQRALRHFWALATASKTGEGSDGLSLVSSAIAVSLFLIDG
jgi:hypothetical protein